MLTNKQNTCIHHLSADPGYHLNERTSPIVDRDSLQEDQMKFELSAHLDNDNADSIDINFEIGMREHISVTPSLKFL